MQIHDCCTSWRSELLEFIRINECLAGAAGNFFFGKKRFNCRTKTTASISVSFCLIPPPMHDMETDKVRYAKSNLPLPGNIRVEKGHLKSLGANRYSQQQKASRNHWISGVFPAMYLHPLGTGYPLAPWKTAVPKTSTQNMRRQKPCTNQLFSEQIA